MNGMESVAVDLSTANKGEGINSKYMLLKLFRFIGVARKFVLEGAPLRPGKPKFDAEGRERGSEPPARQFGGMGSAVSSLRGVRCGAATANAFLDALRAPKRVLWRFCPVNLAFVGGGYRPQCPLTMAISCLGWLYHNRAYGPSLAETFQWIPFFGSGTGPISLLILLLFLFIVVGVTWMKFGKIVLQVNARIESIEEVRIFEMTSYVQDHSAAVCCPLASRAHVTSLVRCECYSSWSRDVVTCYGQKCHSDS